MTGRRDCGAIGPPPTDLERLGRAISTLRPREREVLLLSARDGLGIGEVAARLGIRPARARRILAKALVKVDRALERPERRWWRLW